MPHLPGIVRRPCTYPKHRLMPLPIAFWAACHPITNSCPAPQEIVGHSGTHAVSAHHLQYALWQDQRWQAGVAFQRVRGVWGTGRNEDPHQADVQPLLLRRLHQHLAGPRADLPHVQEDRAPCWRHAGL